MPSLKRLQHDLSVEDIIGAVATVGNVEIDELRNRKTRAKELRQMAMELSYRYSNHSQKEIGAIFGVDYSTVSQNRIRLKAKLKTNRKLKKLFNRVQGKTFELSKQKT